ncbi:MAG: aminotransferase class V-fold PLP-dependent enzyme [Nitrospiraceae bacterium]|nr:aminotransferase class V-fold PLP-dependent enzyme [Nitrospiraceae bacterium]
MTKEKKSHVKIPEVYLDYNATTPVARPVQEAIDFALKDLWGNPSSGHRLGQRAKKALESARTQVASLINADPEEISFTSGGTESNNTVIMGICQEMSSKGRHLITSQIEHPSIIKPCLYMAEQGWEVSFAGVNSDCIVDPVEIEETLRPDTVLVSVMLANNETGAIQSLAEIAQLAHRHGVLVHTDAAQAIGDVKALGVDYLSIAGHKLYAPKGIGALYRAKGSPPCQIIFGGGQEHGLRPGTESVPLAVGLGAACDFVAENMEADIERERGLRERLYEGLAGLGHPVVRNSDSAEGLPNTLSISFVGKNGAEILRHAPEVMASTGSACHEKSTEVSHVLAAMGLSIEVAMGTLRLTLGHWTTESDIEIALQAIGRAAKRITI